MIFGGITEKGSVEGATIIVNKQGGGDYTSIQAAIDNANPGDTINVKPGTYNERLEIDKSIDLLGSGWQNTTIKGINNGDVVTISASSVNISGFYITGSGTDISDAGISLGQVNYCYITNNNISNNNRHGIYTCEASYIYILNNKIFSNKWDGFQFMSSNYFEVINNDVISNLGQGIFPYGLGWSKIESNRIISNKFKGLFYSGGYTTITNNYIRNNPVSLYGLYITFKDNNLIGSSITIDSSEENGPEYYNTHTITNNKIDNQPIYYYQNTNDLTVPKDAKLVILASCSNINIMNLQFYNETCGVELFYSNNIKIKDSSFINNWYGIRIFKSHNNTIDNSLFEKNYWGVHLYADSNDNVIKNSEFFQNDHGIYTIKTKNNLVNNNNLYDNTLFGFFDYLSSGTDAINNWWGTTSGPYHETENPSGSGNNVSGDLTFNPWLNTKVQFNRPPTIQTQNIISIHEDNLYKVIYTANDPNYDQMTWSFNSNAKWLNWGQSNHTLFGKPTNADVGSYWVNIRVSDPKGKSDERNFTLEVINTNLKIITEDITEAKEDIEYIVDYDSDDDDQGEINWVLYTNATWLKINKGSGLVTGIPDNDNVGTYLVNINVTDGNGGFDEHNFTLTILNTNDAPEINNTPLALTFFEDNIDNRINLTDWFFDIDGETLTFYFEDNNNISVVILPNGTVLLIPKMDWSGTEVLTFYANDSKLEISDNITITITPLNDAPSNAVIYFAEMKYYEGQYQPAIGNTTDVDIPYGDKLTYNWSSNITGSIGEGSEVNLSLNAGLHLITLYVTDNTGAWCTTTIEIEILKLYNSEDKIDLDNDGYPDNIDAFPNDPTQWLDSDGDNYGDNLNGINPDIYPNDPTRWEKEDDPTDNKEPDDKDTQDSTWLVIGIAVIIIVIVIMLIFFSLIKRKKKDAIESVAASDSIFEQQFQAQPIIPYQQLYHGQKIQIPSPTQQPQLAVSVQQIQSQQTPPIQKPLLNLCSTCGQQLTYIQHVNRYYCYQCQQYD